MVSMLYKTRYLIIALVFGIIFTANHRNYKNTELVLNAQFEAEQQVIEKSISSAVRNSDLIFRLIEQQYNSEMKKYSHLLAAEYQRNPDISTWDFEKRKAEFDNKYEIYFIDRNLRVVETTFPPDLGLDFSRFANFAALLRSRLQGDQFISDRLDISTNTGEVTKYSYLPTYDHKYLIELSMNPRAVLPLVWDQDVVTVTASLAKEYGVVNGINVYKFGQDGKSTKVITNLKAVNDTGTVSKEVSAAIWAAVSTGEAQQLNGVLPDQRELTHKLLPYLAYDSAGNLDWWNSYVVEIDYDTSRLHAELRQQRNNYASTSVITFGAFLILMLTIGFLVRNLEDHRKLLSTVINETSEGYCRLDLDSRIIALNDAFSVFTGYPSAELNGQKLGDLAADGCAESLELSDLFDSTEMHRKVEAAFIKKDGTMVDGIVNVTVVRSLVGAPQYAFCFVYDVTERKKYEQQMRHLAFHDPLTELPNRKLFQIRLHRVLAAAKDNDLACAVMFIDLDHFKDINDQFGHDAGDRLICLAAERLSEVIRDGDNLCRLGGDEFTVLLPNIEKKDDAASIAQRILESFSVPFDLNGEQVLVHPCIGISMFPGDGTEPETLLKKADDAMYQVKRNGRYNVQFYDANLAG